MRHWRAGALVLVLLLLLGGLMAGGPIAQDLAYHRFADQRLLLGVPNLLDVASNLPFLMVGTLGLALCATRRRPKALASWVTLFIGTTLVSIGSAYYHWSPDSATLVWDRLPMTLGFTGLFVALVSEQIDEDLERYLLVPALAVGLASVLWWTATDDLRLYYWVQLAPLVSIPLLLVLFPARYTHRHYLAYALGLYVLAKVAEVGDTRIFENTGHLLSGHTLKHLLAAFALVAILLMLWRRTPTVGAWPTP
jgi:hypothetical protein